MGSEKLLLISASSLPDNLFTNEALMVACSLGRMNEIKITFLLDTGATSIALLIWKWQVTCVMYFKFLLNN